MSESLRGCVSLLVQCACSSSSATFKWNYISGEVLSSEAVWWGASNKKPLPLGFFSPLLHLFLLTLFTHPHLHPGSPDTELCEPGQWEQPRDPCQSAQLWHHHTSEGEDPGRGVQEYALLTATTGCRHGSWWGHVVHNLNGDYNSVSRTLCGWKCGTLYCLNNDRERKKMSGELWDISLMMCDIKREFATPPHTCLQP